MGGNLQRIYFLDTLKAFIILLVIVLHTSLAYVADPVFPGWIHNPQASREYWLISMIADGFIMPIMFFISGYFTLPSLLKRATLVFLKDKFIRIGIPYLLGIALLAPLLTSLYYFSIGGPLLPASALLLLFTPQYNNQYHFWYLGLLLVFFIGVALVHWLFPRFFTLPQSISRPTLWVWGLIIFLTTILCFGVNLVSDYSGINAWSRLVVLQFQDVKVPLYAVYFMLGIYAYRNKWFKEGYMPRLFPWLIVYLISSGFYLVQVIATLGNPTTILDKFLINFFISIEVLSALLMYLAIFQKLGNGRLLQSISNQSFSVYIVHVNILFIILFVMLKVEMPTFYKFVLQLFLTILLAWGIPLLIDMFHQQKKTELPSTPSIPAESVADAHK